MLAQNFQTADDLGINEKEHQALIKLLKLLGKLERGELHYADPDPRSDDHGDGFPLHGFIHQNECGTVACFAGWVSILAYKGDYQAAMDFARKARKLCLPMINFDLVGPAQAAIALRNYLTTGEPRWEEALS